jgi:hypothetical protein
MAEPIRVSLRYRGPEVDDGEMDISDVVEALQGFSGAYGKIASKLMPEATHQLRVAAIQKSSFDVFLHAAIFLGQGGDAIQKIETVSNAAKAVFGIITKIIGIKKHIKAHPYTFNFRDRNVVTIVNADKLEMNFPPEAFEIFRESLIDGDLNKIVDPLQKNRIESAEIKVQDNSPEAMEAIVTSSERDYFRPSASSIQTEQELVGRLVSLNKDNNRGTFKLGNDTSVRYHYIGENKDQFHRDFSRKGPVKAVAIVDFDENLVPTHLEIKSIELLQSELELTE